MFHLLPTALIALSPAAQAEVDGAELREVMALFDAGATFPLPTVTEEQLAALLGGEVVRWLDRPEGEEGPRRAAALYIAEPSRNLMWLSAQDLHFQGDPSVHEIRLDLRPPDDADWYGFLDLPAPFTNRQWLVRSWNNHALAESSGGRCWEHPWKALDSDLEAKLERVREHAAAGELGPVSPEQIDEAILSPLNHGAFVAIELSDGRTLFGYHAVFDAGGVIPEWAVAQWAYSGLEKAMKNWEERGRDVIPGHYGADHVDVPGGDGRRTEP